MILVPVLERPAAAARLVKDWRKAGTAHSRIVFLTSDGDFAEHAACQRTGCETIPVPWSAGAGDWARKLDYGRARTSEPYMLLAADDLHFHQGWDVAALQKLQCPSVGVLGTQDGGNPLVLQGRHSTHPIVNRSYADDCGAIDDRAVMLHHGYDHAYCDNELVETAMARGVWLFAREVFIEHLHPSWKKARWDKTYAKGAHKLMHDHRLFLRRRPLWRGRRHRRM